MTRNDTERREIRKMKVKDKGTYSVPVGAEVIHTHLAGGTGPLYVWYLEPSPEQ